MKESKAKLLVAQSCLSHCDPMDSQVCQAPLSMGFPRHEHWNGLPFPTPGDLPNSGTKPRSLALQEDSLSSEAAEKPHKRCKGKYKSQEINEFPNAKKEGKLPPSPSFS